MWLPLWRSSPWHGRPREEKPLPGRIGGPVPAGGRPDVPEPEGVHRKVPPVFRVRRIRRLPRAGRGDRLVGPEEAGRGRLAGKGGAAGGEGGGGGSSLRRSTCDAPASLRLTSLPESSARIPLPRLLRPWRAPLRGCLRPGTLGDAGGSTRRGGGPPGGGVAGWGGGGAVEGGDLREGTSGARRARAPAHGIVSSPKSIAWETGRQGKEAHHVGAGQWQGRGRPHAGRGGDDRGGDRPACPPRVGAKNTQVTL